MQIQMPLGVSGFNQVNHQVSLRSLPRHPFPSSRLPFYQLRRKKDRDGYNPHRSVLWGETAGLPSSSPDPLALFRSYAGAPWSIGAGYLLKGADREGEKKTDPTFHFMASRV